MSFLDKDVAALTVLLSPERLGALTQLTGSARAAIELHQETLGLGTSLMTVIATVEIALRNSVCENLSQHFATTGWLMRPPAPFRWRDQERGKLEQALDSARRAAYSKLTQAQKSALDAQAFPRGRPPRSLAFETRESAARAARRNRGQNHSRADPLFLEAAFWARLRAHFVETIT